jgi:hypothetical protein
MTLAATGSHRTQVTLTVDDAPAQVIGVARSTTVSSVALDPIALHLTATKGSQAASIGVDDGHFGVASKGESGAAKWEISGTERLSVSLVETKYGNATDADFRFVGAGRNETVWVEALIDGHSLGRVEFDAQGPVHFASDQAFDQLYVSAGTGDSFGLSDFALTRSAFPDDLGS